MKVNGIDLQKYNAQQLTAEYQPPSLAINYEIITGGLMPVLFQTDMPLGKLKLCLYFRGKDRSSILRNISSLLENVTKQCILEVDGYKGRFKGIISQNEYTKMKVKTCYQVNLEFDGYFYDDEIVLKYEDVTEAVINRMGSRNTPVIVEVYAKKQLSDYKISGFEDEITIKQLITGQTIVIDGEAGSVIKNNKNAFANVDIWKFPAITQQKTILTFSNADAIVQIRYKPMWI